MSDSIQWHDIRNLTVEGQCFSDVAGPFDRLPARARGKVREPVWELSRHSAGLCARFVTSATTIHVRWSLLHESLAMPHMPATGVSGLDLYVRNDQGTWVWAACGRPEKHPENAQQLIAGLPAGRREFLLYLPLYNGVTRVELGIPEESPCDPGPARPADSGRPVIFYGTSITQGGCASRPGMAHVALLGRWLDREAINLGFSGNGTMDPEIGEYMAEVDAAAYVIDCLPNMQPDAVTTRTIPLVRILRAKRPDAPVILVEDRTATNAHLLPGTRQLHHDRRLALRRAYAQLVNAGDSNLHYQSGADLLGCDFEGTVDGSHPTDLGFVRQARCLLPLLQQVTTR